MATTCIATSIERVDIFGLTKQVKTATITRKPGNVQKLPVDKRTRVLEAASEQHQGQSHYHTEVKLTPWIDLKMPTWSIKLD